MKESWNTGILEYKNTGILEYRDTGIQEYWNGRKKYDARIPKITNTLKYCMLSS